MLRLFLLAVPVASEYVRVPGGMWVHNSCMHEVSNGEMVDVPDCPHPMYPADQYEPHGETMLPKLQAPHVQCYDQKAYVTASTEFTGLNASFVVPPMPKRNVGQTVFLWPGFKAIAPVIMKPVLQPVLQSYNGASWQMQSWGVGIPAGTMTGPKIDVREGDLVTTYMDLVGNTWTIYAQNTRTREESVLRLSKSQACSGCEYTNALFVSENVMDRNQCDYYPNNHGIEYTDIVVNGVVDHHTAWQTGYDCGSPDCQQKVVASDDGKTVKLTWNGDSPSPSPTPTPSPTPGCDDVDSASDCSYWQQQGYCSSSSQYYSYMQENCCHTCGFGEVQV